MSSNEKNPIAFTGGGTGGHVYPAKPIIDLIFRENPTQRVYWIGSSGGVEKEIVESWNLDYHGIPTGKLRRYFSLQNFSDLFRILSGFFKARRILRKNRPVYLFSKGGFVSVPPVLAAWSLRIPVFTHESDVTPGLATRINSPFVKKVFLPYEKSLNYTSAKYRKKCIISGNPVREEFFSGDSQKGRDFVGADKEFPLLLVFGGSLGAEQINTLITENLDSLSEFCFIVHQTGPKNYTPLEHKNYFRTAYFHEEIYHIMAAAQGALTRCGANSLWELTAAGVPMLMIPLIKGTRGDQVDNAKVFEESGAGTILNDNTLTNDLFLTRVKELLNSEVGGKGIAEALNLGKAERIILDTINCEESP